VKCSFCKELTPVLSGSSLVDSRENIIPTLNPIYAKRRAYRMQSAHQKIWDVLDNVFDPELPGLTIWDLGILQDVEYVNDRWQIKITPTYSGCPAVDVINDDIKTEMANASYDDVVVKVVLSPAWETDMISPNGKAHLKSINIAPPVDDDVVCCPQCDSTNTKLISQFGSTGCKALYQCNDCFEAFDYFKKL
jgi:ring-1,2-phenylacetyl-CoA epoxidase subunit PaaD